MSSTFLLRPSNSEKEPFRIKLSAASLLHLKVRPGDVCVLKHADKPAAGKGGPGYAIAWEAPGGIKDNVVQTSKFLQELYGFVLGERIVISRVFWEKYAELTVGLGHEYLAPGQTLSFRVGQRPQQQHFVVVGTNAGSDDGQHAVKIGKVTDHTRFRLTTKKRDDDDENKKEADSPVFISDQIGGLQDEVKKVQRLISRLVRAGIRSSSALSPAQGVLIFGAKGVGDDSSKNLNELHDLFLAVKDRRCLAIGEVAHPNDVHPELRTLTTFSEEIEIPIPSSSQRREILAAIWGSSAAGDDDSRSWVIDQLAERTHGYVAADLYRVLRLTLDSAAERTEKIILETPSTRWTDIGGQCTIKQQLINAVERPLKQAAQMAKMSLPPKKGLLMYGPPGCSKTLLVRALARESGLNFLAVKGAELISQYVGESERAVREVFRKARAAAPSILFFDEIDSIAIDPALLRPGRFDDVVYIGPPDLDARTEIFRKELAKSNYTPRQETGSIEEDARYFAERTEGRSGAEVVAVRTTACGFALDRGEDGYGFDDVEKALECVGRSISREMVAGFERWAAVRAGRERIWQ
ncbi:hypothetical protein DV735_g4349, partial [Chaetothyriales sp. CBS 134920]